MRLPQTIGPWRLLSRLGQGAFGTVYLGVVAGDLGFRQIVAVKLVDPDLAALQPAIVAALTDEANLLSRLRHPNIVGVRQLVRVSHDVLGDTVGMELEYVEGQTLRTLLGDAAGPLSIPEVLAVLAGVLEALKYAHGFGELVHRDLKPDNVMVDLMGQPRVLDFGIAWARHGRANETKTGMTKGTLQYMSPEQVRGEPVDARSDLYSLGVVAFEALAGEPFVAGQAGSPSERVRLMSELVATTYEDRREALSAALQDPDRHYLEPLEARRIDAFVAPLLAADPDDRPPSAAAALEALENLYDVWRPELGRRELASRCGRMAPTRPLSQELVDSGVLEEAPPPPSAEEDARTDPGASAPSGDVPAEPGGRPPPAVGDANIEDLAEGETVPGTGGGDDDDPAAAARRSRRAARRRAAAEAQRRATIRALAAALAAAVLGLVIILVVLLDRPPADEDAAPPVAPARVAAVDVAGDDATTTVTFRDDRGGVVLAPVLPGKAGADALDLVRGRDGLPAWAVVGTTASDTEPGVLVLYDLRGATPSPAWRVDAFFEETPEEPIGAHRATTYGFDGVALLPGTGAPPAAVAVARDRFYAPSWLVRVGPDGAIAGRRYHPGHLARTLALDANTVAVAGVSNRLCPGGTAPCEQVGVLWVTTPPAVAAEGAAEFPPGCGGGDVPERYVGYWWDPAAARVDGLTAADDGFTLSLMPKAEGACVVRATFGADGEYEGQYSDCGAEVEVAAVVADPAICEAWATVAE